ncbi:xanthine dehydrogenase family protein subunit M [Xanthobacteraceae bacterium Astr-EGSB]|uniref:FAD binding domain-containing protein n=1 Tax=Astrobacterium formosum TaxID=3069710 RepID=UPI0027B8440E|nr:xanthine dehydrogenase family protein subunit M [Xanthobacteraceae bacterium Astr-EGSB]
MRPFHYERAATPAAAVKMAGTTPMSPDQPSVATPVQYLAGGTNLLDMMKIDVMRPDRVVDINAIAETRHGGIEVSDDGMWLGALARMAEVAEHADVKHRFPVIAQSLTLAASQQLRNMASIGGNVLQRTRCPYYRDTSYAECNKRDPGSGCAALGGFNRMHAVLGTSKACIATYPGDFAQALIALDARVEITGAHGHRSMAFAELHRRPDDEPHMETRLAPGELITAFTIAALPWARRSKYLKIRDRESYEFALASAAVALDMDGDIVREARIALGGVATVPWRASAAEHEIQGKRLDERALAAAAEAAFADARVFEHNAFKIALGKRTLTRALRETAAMET